ncbi:MAG TPA: hypothetical protein VF463_14780 [Sphingobium sp.]
MMLDWLIDNVSVFKVQHNAHHEFRMSVQQHLAHRERIGNAPMFLTAQDSDICIAEDILWELRVILDDGAIFDLAGSNLGNCIRATRDLIVERRTRIAA